MIRVPNSFSLEVLAALVAEDALLDGAVVRLYQNDYVPGATSTVEDFEEADFTGYAASSAIVWGTPGMDGVSAPRVVGDLKLWTGGTPFTTGNTLYGVFITNAAGDELLYAERFPAQKFVSGAGQQIGYLPIVSLVSQAG